MAGQNLAYPGAVEQVVASVNAMIETFGALFARNSDIKAQHLGGAVKIMDVYYRLFDSEQGWRLAIWFSVLMNVNLAMLNLLPIPVLDGGHITLAIVEGIRRKPLSAKIVGAIQTACAVLLDRLHGLHRVLRSCRICPGNGARKSPELQFAPKPATARLTCAIANPPSSTSGGGPAKSWSATRLAAASSSAGTTRWSCSR